MIESFGINKGKYKHFKGNMYNIICVAEGTEDGKLEVVYRALYGSYKCYRRPLAMFKEYVVHNGIQVPRFEYVGGGL